MDSKDFTYWLQGWVEMSNPTTMNEAEMQVMKDHLALVLKKETPNRTQNRTPHILEAFGPHDVPETVGPAYPLYSSVTDGTAVDPTLHQASC